MSHTDTRNDLQPVPFRRKPLLCSLPMNVKHLNHPPPLCTSPFLTYNIGTEEVFLFFSSTYFFSLFFHLMFFLFLSPSLLSFFFQLASHKGSFLPSEESATCMVDFIHHFPLWRPKKSDTLSTPTSHPVG